MMSIILDALRRGREGQGPAPNPSPSQTDAVLQTLGYARVQRATPLQRIKRAVGLLVLAAVLAVLIWAAVTRF